MPRQLESNGLETLFRQEFAGSAPRGWITGKTVQEDTGTALWCTPTQGLPARIDRRPSWVSPETVMLLYICPGDTPFRSRASDLGQVYPESFCRTAGYRGRSQLSRGPWGGAGFSRFLFRSRGPGRFKNSVGPC